MNVSPHRSLFETIGASPVAMVISNPRLRDNPIEAANPAFCELTGYSEREIVGRNCRFLTGEDTEAWQTQRLRDAIKAARPVLVDIINYRKDGSRFRNGVMITPLFDDEGAPAWFLGSQVDLGDGSADPITGLRDRASGLVSALPPRQRQVLELMTQGRLNKQIAYELGISEKTVKMHRGLLLERLGVATSAEAIRIGVEAGF